jgi:predicted DNA-binding transcriptional regulator AlpA
VQDGYLRRIETKCGSLNMVDPDDYLVTDFQASRKLGCSKATFWRRVADGTIPKPVKIGGMSRWPLSEIVAVIEAAKSRREV